MIKPRISGSRSDSEEARRPSLTDVEGLLVGHNTLQERPTGCTVITSLTPFTAGVDVRGGAPGTRETDLLKAENFIEKIHAIVLSGGSAFGLDTAAGVTKYLEEQGRGFDVQVAKVPIVCGAILIDLRLGDPKIRPDAKSGYAAAKAAASAPVTEGNVGAGAGATVGKILGMGRGMKAGLGSWSLRRSDGLTVGALAVANCAGDVLDPARGKIIAGARKTDGSGFVDILEQLRKGYQPGSPFLENTALGVVATNATLSKAQCNKMAQMSQDALARCVRPSHTPWDGDTVFAVSTGTWKNGSNVADVGLIGALAADVLETAILRAVEQADSWGPYPAAKDFPRKTR
jgi:L-aminopeptidase/D-esterase-like protein